MKKLILRASIILTIGFLINLVMVRYLFERDFKANHKSYLQEQSLQDQSLQDQSLQDQSLQEQSLQDPKEERRRRGPRRAPPLLGLLSPRPPGGGGGAGIGPPAPPPGSLVFVGGTSLLFILGASIAWVVPLTRRLSQLRRTTRRISDGDLSARCNDRGNDAISEVGIALDEMAGRVEDMIRSQRHLLQAVSHEVRTPIARMRFHLEAMEGGTNQKHVEALDEEITEIDELVGELLTLIRLDEPHAHLPVDVIDLEHEIQLLTLRLQKDTALKVEIIDESVNTSSVEGNLRAVRHALRNVLANAFRYAETSILVRINDADGERRIFIEDDGPGIPVEDRQRLLRPFERVDEGRQRSSGGVGLGLAIVDRAMQRHQGTVLMSESPSGGACVELRFPHT